MYLSAINGGITALSEVMSQAVKTTLFVFEYIPALPAIPKHPSTEAFNVFISPPSEIMTKVCFHCAGAS